MSRQAKNVARYLFTQLPWSLVGVWVIASVLAVGLGVANRVWTSSVDVPGTTYWEAVSGAIKVYLLVIGILLTPMYLPVFVANGTTRCDFTRGSLAYGAIAATASALVIYLGYAVEGVIYRVNGWTHATGMGHLFLSPNEPAAVLVEYALLCLAYFLSGWLIGSGYYRFGWWKGLFFMAAGAIPLVGVEWVVQDLSFWLPQHLDSGLLPLLICTALGLGAIAVGLWLHHRVAHDLTIRRKLI